MTFTSIASNNTHDTLNEPTVLNILKLSKISIAASLLTIVGVTLFQNLFWTSASYPAEIPHPHVAPTADVTIAK